MDLETMQTVCMVALTESFSLAAEKIPCSQPTISRRIKMAEDELGVVIFNRSANHKLVTMTIEGRKIVEKFACIVKDYNELKESFQNHKEASLLESVVLGIAGNTMITSAGEDYLYSDFINHFPNSSFRIAKDTEKKIVNRVGLGEVDYGLLVRYVWNDADPFIHYYMDANYRTANIARHDLYIAVASCSELAQRGSVQMKDLADVSFVYSENLLKIPADAHLANHFIFFEACRLAGFTTNIKTIGHISRSVRTQAVVSGVGSTHCAVPERLGAYSGVSYVKVTDAPIHAEFFLLSKKEVRENEFQMMSSWLKTHFS